MIVTQSVRISAVATDDHMPFIPNNKGSNNTVDIWKTNVLKNEIAAEIGPLFSAVKNDEPKIL